MNRFMLLPLVALCLLCSCNKGNNVLRIGIIKPSIDHLPLSYAMDNGKLESSAYSLVEFSSGWEAQEAIIAGRVDVAIMPFTYVWNAASRGYPVRLASFFERETDAIITRKSITFAAQLQGRKIGLLKASTLEVLWMDFAAKQGISATSVYFRTPNEAVAALENAEVDAIVLYVPLANKLEGKYNVIHWFGEDYPMHPCCDVAVNTQSVAKGRTSTLKRFLADLKGMVDGFDASSPDLRKYIMDKYGLDAPQCVAALRHTGFRMGLDSEGKDFQREMASISAELGYLQRVPADEEVYWKP